MMSDENQGLSVDPEVGLRLLDDARRMVYEFTDRYAPAGWGGDTFLSGLESASVGYRNALSALARAVEERDECKDDGARTDKHLSEVTRSLIDSDADLARVTAKGDEWAALVADLREALRVRGEQSVLLAEALKFYAGATDLNAVSTLLVDMGHRARKALGEKRDE